MNVAQHISADEASAVGGRTLEVFADTPRINRWIYSKIAPHVHGDVLEIGSGIGNLSGHIAGNATRVVLSDMEDHYLQSLSQRFAGDERIMAQYGLPPTLMGTVYSTFLITYMLAMIPGGWVISWPGIVDTLSAAPEVTGPYYPIYSATSPYTNYFTEPQQFFLISSPYSVPAVDR